MGLEIPLADPIIEFTLLVVLALAVQLAFRRLEIPPVVGLIAAGMLFGPGGFGILPREPIVELFGAIGLVYIMFLAGLEIDMEVVRHHKREGLTFGVLAFALSFVPGAAVGRLLTDTWTGAILIATAISSHTLLAYPIVQRLGLLHHRAIVAAIGGTLLTDTLALIVLVIAVQTAGGAEGAAGWAGPLLLLAALVAVSLVLLPRLGEYFLEHTRATRAVKALFLLAVLLVLAATAKIIGTEDILGAFLAGVCLNLPVRRRPELLEHVEFVGRMLFIPLFFVETGMRLQLDVLMNEPRAWMLAGLLLAVIVAGKFGAAWISGRLFGYATAAWATMAALTLPQAAATLAVTVTARQADLISSEVLDGIIIVILLSCLAGPLLTRAAGRRVRERDRAERPHPPDAEPA
jgi:Kef-type K+ transport system membrane component KefB